uniref:Uncharacterized protein n=1 Tax=Meloidogyne javanica TaxID=6303 RepID=A0A915M431_MELJA
MWPSVDTKNALDNASDVILKLEEELKKSDKLIAELRKKIKELEEDKLKPSYNQGSSAGSSGTGHQRFEPEQMSYTLRATNGQKMTSRTYLKTMELE